MNKTYIQKGSDVKKDILSIYGITNKHFPDIQLELKELFRRDWAEQQGDQEYIPSTAMFKAYEQDMEFVCMDTLAAAGATIKTFLAYLQGAEFSFYSEYHNRGFRCRYVGYDSKAFYREAEDVVVFNVKVKINNPLSYVAIPVPTIIYTPQTTGASRYWWGISINPVTSDIFAVVNNLGVYKKSGGIGFFNEIETGLAENLTGVSVNSANGNVYICTSGTGDIYKQSGGIGEFVAQNATGSRKNWSGISVNSANGDVYACINSGDIYKQSSGSGNWVAQNATGAIKGWWGVTVNYITRDVYACEQAGDIYKQTAGSGNFVAQDATGATQLWSGISVNSITNDVYACVLGSGGAGKIYKQTEGAGGFVDQDATGATKNWNSISVNPTNGYVYACVHGGDIYKKTSGDFVAQIATIAIHSHVFAVSFTTNSTTIAYWSDGTTNTYTIGNPVSKTLSEGDFGIICPQKL